MHIIVPRMQLSVLYLLCVGLPSSGQQHSLIIQASVASEKSGKLPDFSLKQLVISFPRTNLQTAWVCLHISGSFSWKRNCNLTYQWCKILLIDQSTVPIIRCHHDVLSNAQYGVQISSCHGASTNVRCFVAPDRLSESQTHRITERSWQN